jgi:hypothetical protein
MLFRSALVTILASPALIRGGQIPAVDGVIGGVPSSGARNFKNLGRAVSGDASTPPTPGKLRVVEKSGVCGGSFCLLRIPFHNSYSHSRKKLRQVSIRLPDMVTWLRIRPSGLCSMLSVPSIFICDPPNRFWFFAARKNPDKAPLITWFNGGVSDTVRHSILQYSGIISAWKFEHDWVVSGARSLPYQQPEHWS